MKIRFLFRQVKETCLGRGGVEMAYETKVILIALAQIALRTDARVVYNAIMQMANAEGVVLKSWDEARAELVEEKNE